MADQSAELKERIASLSDEELLMMVSTNLSDYRQEAINCALAVK